MLVPALTLSIKGKPISTPVEVVEFVLSVVAIAPLLRNAPAVIDTVTPSGSTYVITKPVPPPKTPVEVLEEIFPAHSPKEAAAPESPDKIQRFQGLPQINQTKRPQKRTQIDAQTIQASTISNRLDRPGT